MSRVVIHTDGGARGNPGPAAIGVVVELEKDGRRELVGEIAETIGVATNNVAEYRALIRGLEEALRLGGTEAECLLDSKLVVEQMSGHYKVKHPNVVGLHAEAQAQARKFRQVAYRYVPRAQNAEADRLVNAALDGKPVTGGGGEVPRTDRELEGRRPAAPAAASPVAPGMAAMELVRAAYYAAADMAEADVDAVNRRRPPGMRYESRRQLVRESLVMAAAQADFAVRLGLIEPDELQAFLREFWADQPDLVGEEDEAWIQQSLDLSHPA